MVGRYFGTDGIRGVANREPMTPERALRLGQVLAESCGTPRPVVIVGRDTRRSGPMLEAALVAGLCSAGAEARLAGVVPTPAVAWLTRTTGAAAGVVVSASHNPFEDNGLKILGPDGFKLPDETEARIEAALEGAPTAERPVGLDVGTAAPLVEAEAAYRSYLRATLPDPGFLVGVRLVLDCGNGAASGVGPALFRELGAEVTVLHASPDGRNINENCGALHAGNLAEAVRSAGARAGVTLDGDADRVMLVDEQGSVLDGDELLAILAADALKRGALGEKCLVATVMSNLGLDEFARAHGLQLHRTPVGDRHVVEAMRRHRAQVGGEQSGHLVLLDHATTGDGLLAALHVLAAVLRSGQPLSELRRLLPRYPQVLVNVRVARREDPESLPGVCEAVAAARQELGEAGRVLLRPSGTEPLVRVLVEGREEDRVRRLAESIAETLRQAPDSLPKGGKG